MKHRPVRLRALTSLAELKQIAAEWNQLWLKCPRASTFQRPDWLIPWTEAFAPQRLWVLEARRKGVLAGLAPLFIYGTDGDRILAPLGAGISDYLDLLVDPLGATDVLEAFLDFLGRWTSEWTQLDFPDLPPSSLLLRRPLRSALDHQIEFCNACPQLALPAKIEDLKTVVRPKQMRNLRVARRQIEAAGGARVELATRETAGEFLAALFRLHGRRWQRNAEPGVLADPAVRDFYCRMVPRLLACGVLRFFGLRFRGELVACLLSFFEQEVAYLYMQGYDPDLAHFSPGAQLIGALLEEAIREGKNRADFLRGRERYKYSWGVRDIATFRVRATSHSSIRVASYETSAA